MAYSRAAANFLTGTRAARALSPIPKPLIGMPKMGTRADQLRRIYSQYNGGLARRYGRASARAGALIPPGNARAATKQGFGSLGGGSRYIPKKRAPAMSSLAKTTDSKVLNFMASHPRATAAGGILIAAQMLHGHKQRQANSTSRGRITGVSSGSIGQFMPKSMGGSTF